MRKNVIFLFIFIFIFSINSQAQQYFRVAFKNKNNSDYSLSKPGEYLSQRAIQRREKQNIVIDSLDLPVNANYISDVVNLGAELVHVSKWLNGITVKTEIDSFKNKVLQLSFVKEVQLTKPATTQKSAINKFYEPSANEYAPIDTGVYGASVFQTGISNGQFLHNQNFKGQGMVIAILDAGFYHADTFAAFDSLWNNNQIIGTKDFVNPSSDIFAESYHGMSVLSCMGGNVPGELIGTAPKASFWLLRSEDVTSEYLIEEDNWIAAAEFADSVGADVINSSLGYFTFDDSTMNHTYSQMNGMTTRVTRGANIAASRGMLVFASAGNEGNDAWKYIIAPSDGDCVIGVGAVNKDGQAAYFTSYGPASDGDIKPNLSAVGWNTFLQKADGTLGYSSGTSFASPVMAGMGTCLWQANPHATAIQIKQALEQSANLFNNPDSLLGFGIPDMELADHILKILTVKQLRITDNWFVYPNPVTDLIVIQQNNKSVTGEVKIEIFSIDGKLLQNWVKLASSKIILRNIRNLPAGILLLKISDSAFSETIKLNKIF